MDARLKSASRWMLALLTLLASSLTLFIFLMGVMLWPDRILVATFTAIGILPRATIEIAHRFDFLAALLFWILPVASAIGFAARKSQRRSLSFGLSVSVLLFATICFFWGRQDHSAVVQGLGIIAGIVVLSATIFSFLRRNLFYSLNILNLIVILLLFSPSIVSLSRSIGRLPQPKELWSTTLQQDTWQSMNTGSEYAATRQIAFAGDRVVAVFDAGFERSQPSKDKWPLSSYRLLSLDLKTGTKVKEITISGRWGSMPYVYPTQGGFINVQSDPPRTLDQDLTSATDKSNAALAPSATNLQRPECGGANCNPRTFNLGKNALQLRQRQFNIVDSTGKIISDGNLVDWGSFAGASADGTRFAVQSSSTEGDPDFVVYEYFTIYEAATGKAVAMIHMKNLPARQSWSAFSSNGRYFAVGNPNKLTLYELP